MRISELSAESGVPIATIKYYLREGLLPPGEQTAATRAEYDLSHLRRLRLIRALLEVGRLPLSTIRTIIKAVEDESLSLHDMLGVAHHALARPEEPHPAGEDWREAKEMVDRLITEMGWHVGPCAPTRDELAWILVTLKRLGLPATHDDLIPYAKAAYDVVRSYDMKKIPFDAPRDTLVETVVIYEVLYGKAFDVLRRLAQESESARLLRLPMVGAPASSGEPDQPPFTTRDRET